ncbi:TlpA family protein disulfide reductase [Cytophagales bacterium RKSG123]|nr:TlpA family protein disulfide reductase [Xanthovirga aplysinae]
MSSPHLTSHAKLFFRFGETHKGPLEDKIEADYSLKMRELGAGEVTMEKFRGKLIYLKVWSTTCPTCVEEMPKVQALYDKVDKEKVAFVLISVDKEDKKVQKFMEKEGYSFPVFRRADKDWPTIYDDQAFPRVYVISPKGKLLKSFKGKNDFEVDEMADFLDMSSNS